MRANPLEMGLENLMQETLSWAVGTAWARQKCRAEANSRANWPSQLARRVLLGLLYTDGLRRWTKPLLLFICWKMHHSPPIFLWPPSHRAVQRLLGQCWLKQKKDSGPLSPWLLPLQPTRWASKPVLSKLPVLQIGHQIAAKHPIHSSDSSAQSDCFVSSMSLVFWMLRVLGIIKVSVCWKAT